MTISFGFANWLSKNACGEEINSNLSGRQKAAANLLAQNWRPIEIVEFLNKYFVGEVKGRLLWKTPLAAAIAAGGIDFESNYQYWNFGKGGIEIPSASIIWNNDGWRGGCGGGIRAFIKPRYIQYAREGRKYENCYDSMIMGYYNF